MEKERKIQVQKECVICHQIKTVRMSEEEYENFERYMSGEGLIQDMLPDIDYRERELFISGVCSDCWKKMFGTASWEQNSSVDDD